MTNIYRANYNEKENRGGHLPPPNKKNKKDFKTLKKKTFKSLNDVEYFLNNLGQFFKTAKIIKLFK